MLPSSKIVDTFNYFRVSCETKFVMVGSFETLDNVSLRTTLDSLTSIQSTLYYTLTSNHLFNPHYTTHSYLLQLIETSRFKETGSIVSSVERWNECGLNTEAILKVIMSIL